MLRRIVAARCVSAVALALTAASMAHANTVIHGILGGDIYGYDVDHTGSEGVLAEAALQSDGKWDVAIETFDQNTGQIIRVLKRANDTSDSFAALGIVGNGVALFERAHAKKHTWGVRNATFAIANPVSKNRLTGSWRPPPDSESYRPLDAVSGDQGSAATAFLVEDPDSKEKYTHYVFSSDVAANTFGPVIELTGLRYPVMAFDATKDTAVIANWAGCADCRIEMVLANLVTGKVTRFTGLGSDSPQGVAVDPADGIACTTTSDGYIEFYDLRHRTAHKVSTPNHHGTFWSGGTVSFDPINKLFLVIQQNSSTAPSGSSVQIYDPSGNLAESVNGLHSTAYHTIDRVAFNPNTRTVFVLNGNDTKEIETFHY